MYSVIGFLTKPKDVSAEEFRAWWFEEHAPKVLQYPGMREYTAWPIDELLIQDSLEFAGDPPYAGVAIISFDSKQTFVDAVSSATGRNVNDSFNKGAPSSLVLCGQQYVFMRDGRTVDPAQPSTPA